MHVAVVGAGIVGAAAAHFLAAAGARVTLLDASGPAAGATGASDGAVSVASKRPGPMMELARHARAFYGQLEAEGLFTGLFHRRSTFLIAQNALEAELVSQHGADLALAGERVIEVTRADLVKRIRDLATASRPRSKFPMTATRLDTRSPRACCSAATSSCGAGLRCPKSWCGMAVPSASRSRTKPCRRTPSS